MHTDDSGRLHVTSASLLFFRIRRAQFSVKIPFGSSRFQISVLARADPSVAWTKVPEMKNRHLSIRRTTIVVITELDLA